MKRTRNPDAVSSTNTRVGPRSKRLTGSQPLPNEVAHNNSEQSHLKTRRTNIDVGRSMSDGEGCVLDWADWCILTGIPREKEEPRELERDPSPRDGLAVDVTETDQETAAEICDGRSGLARRVRCYQGYNKAGYKD